MREIGFCDFDIIAEHRSVTNLETADTRALLLCAFEFCEPTFIISRQAAETVQLGVIASADIISILEVIRERVRQGGR